MTSPMELTTAQQQTYNTNAQVGRTPVDMDPFMDDTPIVASCDLSNPESCDSCQ